MQIFKSVKLKSSFLIFIILTSFIFWGAISFHETGTINADGSGNLTLTYSTKTSEIQKNSNVIGNFPFTDQLIKEYFSSANTQVKNPSISKNKNDTTLTSVSVNVAFKNINLLNQLKAFTGMKINYDKIDDKSKLFRWVITPDASGKLDEITSILTFECESLSSAVGIVKDKTITFYKDSKKSDFTKEIIFGATDMTDGKTNVKTTETGSNKSDEPKSCGLFGLEFPVLMLAGLVFSYNIKRRKA